MRIVCLLACFACSSGSSAPAHPQRPPHVAPDAGIVAAPGPSADDCERLVTHAVELTLHERTPPIEPAPADAERVKLDQALRPFVAECMTLSRESVRCGLEAPTVSALSACQATRSSSTSNSSVAPGGMTPPAPRSP